MKRYCFLRIQYLDASTISKTRRMTHLKTIFRFGFSTKANSLVTYVLYFGYNALASLRVFTVMGVIGVVTALWINKTIISSIKIDLVIMADSGMVVVVVILTVCSEYR
jgi:hypothetical protein